MSNIEAVIFDFNGTLFWDSAFHDKAWREFSLAYLDKEISGDEMKQHVHGRTNKDILTYLFSKELTQEEYDNYAHTKEDLYKKLVSSPEGLTELAPGVESCLNYLKDKKIPINIATSSNAGNVDFYFRHLNLDKWFQRETVAFDDGTIHSKPAPDIFLRAISNINKEAQKCIVLEDSIAGIKSAKAAGAKKVIFVENDMPVEYSLVENVVDGKINHFDQFYSFIN